MSNAQIATLAVGLISITEGASAIQAPAGAWAPRARQSYCRAL